MPATNDDHGWAALESGTVTADVGLGIVYRTSTGQRCETPTRLGYGRVMVQRTPRTIYVMAHRLIWMAAHGPIPSGDLQVNHINKRPWDNRIVNLELVTAGGNISHSQDRWYVALTNDDPAGQHLIEPPTKAEPINPYATTVARKQAFLGR